MQFWSRITPTSKFCFISFEAELQKLFSETIFTKLFSVLLVFTFFFQEDKKCSQLSL